MHVCVCVGAGRLDWTADTDLSIDQSLINLVRCIARSWEGTRAAAGERGQAVTLWAALGRDGLEAGDLEATWAAGATVHCPMPSHDRGLRGRAGIRLIREKALRSMQLQIQATQLK